MKKNTLLMMSLFTLIGCFNQNSIYSTDYSKYKIVELKEDEAKELVLGAKKSPEVDLEEINSFIGNYSQKTYTNQDTIQKIETIVNYDFRKNNYKLEYSESTNDVNKMKITYTIYQVDDYLVYDYWKLDTKGDAPVETKDCFVRQKANLEELLMWDEILRLFSYLSYSNLFIECLNDSSTFYGRELSPELTKKRVFAPDFIKLTDGKSENNQSLFAYYISLSGVVNKGWMTSLSSTVIYNPSFSSNNEEILNISCNVE